MRLSTTERSALVRFIDTASTFMVPEDDALVRRARQKLAAPAETRTRKTAPSVDPRQTVVPGAEPEEAPDAAAERAAQPFVKWAGGKRQILAEIRARVPASFDTYIEPFVGGGALFFDLAQHPVGAARLRVSEPGNPGAMLADTNKMLVAAYHGVRDSVDDVVAKLRTYAYDSEEYYARRAQMLSMLDDPATDVDRAAWLIYMNRCCFNGVYRVNKKGEFNVPFGKYTNPTICDEPLLRACSLALQGVMIATLDFEVLMDKAKAGGFIYCDPPYAPVSASSFTAYTEGGFGAADHVRLRNVALRAASRGAHVLLSNADTPFVRELYSGDAFQLHDVSARRNVNSAGAGRGVVGELLITIQRQSVARGESP